MMENLSSQQIFDLTAGILKAEGLPEPKSIWVWQDVYSSDLIKKGVYSNVSRVTVYLRIEGKELLSFNIETSDQDEYKKQLKKIISNDLKLFVY